MLRKVYVIVATQYNFNNPVATFRHNQEVEPSEEDIEAFIIDVRERHGPRSTVAQVEIIYQYSAATTT